MIDEHPDFLPNRINLITREDGDTVIGAINFGFSLTFTENKPSALSTEEGSDWQNILNDFKDNLQPKINKLLEKFFEDHPKAIPSIYCSQGFQTTFDSYIEMLALLDRAHNID